MMQAREHRIVVMGVSAVGKSTIGALLAQHLDVPFIDGDDLHSPISVAKMAAGTPLTDDDRTPWLVSCGRALQQSRGGGVIACSALRRRYRDIIRSEAPEAMFAHLRATRSIILRRAQDRVGHFMPPALLTSQENTLEPLQPDEPGLTLEAGGAGAALVAEIIGTLAGSPRKPGDR